MILVWLVCLGLGFRYQSYNPPHPFRRFAVGGLVVCALLTVSAGVFAAHDPLGPSTPLTLVPGFFLGVVLDLLFFALMMWLDQRYGKPSAAKQYGSPPATSDGTVERIHPLTWGAIGAAALVGVLAIVVISLNRPNPPPQVPVQSAVVAVPSPVVNFGTADFKPVTSREGGFTVSFPGDPTKRTSTSGIATTAFVAARGDSEAYTVAYTDAQQSFHGARENQSAFDHVCKIFLPVFLEQFRQFGAAVGGGAMDDKDIETKEVPIQLGPYPGRELQAENQILAARSRLYFARGRVYQLTVFSLRSSRQPAAEQAFFDSFKITDE